MSAEIPAQLSLSVRSDMSTEDVDVTWPVLPQRQKYKEKKVVSTTARALHGGTSTHTAAVGVAEPQTGGYEYLDHTADVQIHSWGADEREAFGAAAAGMFGYMVELEEFGCELTRKVTANGHDWHSMLFAFLDECLYVFHTEELVMSRVVVESIDRDSWTVTAHVRGGLFDATRDRQGTEIKAITYSNMQIIHPGDEASAAESPERKAQVYVIVDI